MKRPNRAFLACAGVIAGIWALGGCYAQRRVGAGAEYPVELSQTSVRDVQVQRHGTRVSLTNTSAQPLGPGTMWINGQFAREIGAVGVGESASFALGEFRNSFGERFRAGGFFATERPDRVVSAQVEQDGRLIGLVVVGGGEE